MADAANPEPRPDEGDDVLAEIAEFARRKSVGSGQAGTYRGLSSQEYALYTVLFVLVPGACVIISSALYYAWRRDHPRKARQINRLGWTIVCLQLLSGCAWTCLMPMLH
jgi:hypothetical protein